MLYKKFNYFCGSLKSVKNRIMTRNLLYLLIMFGLISSCSTKNENTKAGASTSILGDAVLDETIESLKVLYPDYPHEKISKGVRHAGSLWWAEDGTAEDFKVFCINNFAANYEMRNELFAKLDNYFAAIFGHYNWMRLRLFEPVHLKYGKIMPIDEMFSGYNPSSHLFNDLYNNKIAFVVALNFPFYSLSEKEVKGKTWDRKEWAYARMGDLFTSRIPSELLQNYSKINSEANIYISQYNIHAGKLLDDAGNKLFPDEMILLSHWNLRDELKSNYPSGIEKQRLIYSVMQHIIEQTIPQQVINNPDFDWSPYNNKVFQNGNVIASVSEPDTRYEKLLNNFQALRAMDDYSPLNTFISRRFDSQMEIAQKDVEELFIKFISSDLMKDLGALISSRLGRDLEPFDIWYDGFKPRSELNEDFLNAQTRARYPNAAAMEKDLPNLMVKLGYSRARAEEICSKITVDPARGSGHAWGAAMKGMQSHLRTRIPDEGMDYKGYNIAIHELGHNVEQTISLYDIDYYMLRGVPNTAFTEALAFAFQRRDLELLGIKTQTDEQSEAFKILDVIWQNYEIMGVSLLDMRVWKWLYENPQATKTTLKEAVIRIAKEIWNDYYSPVYGHKDTPILAIYSHMIASPLYLSDYAFGIIIEFQIEQFLKNNDFATTVDRIYSLGRLTPNQWMQQAVGENIDIEPMLAAGFVALNKVR
jgi:hypothetical protein